MPSVKVWQSRKNNLICPCKRPHISVRAFFVNLAGWECIRVRGTTWSFLSIGASQMDIFWHEANTSK
jgi:hypothetical protein